MERASAEKKRACKAREDREGGRVPIPTRALTFTLALRALVSSPRSLVLPPILPISMPATQVNITKHKVRYSTRYQTPSLETISENQQMESLTTSENSSDSESDAVEDNLQTKSNKRLLNMTLTHAGITIKQQVEIHY